MDYVGVAGVIVTFVVGAMTIVLMLKKSRHDASHKRVAVYSAIKKLLNAVSQLGEVPVEVERAFQDATEDEKVELLFKNGDDRAYIRLLRLKVNDLRRLRALETGFPNGERKSRITLERLHLVQWMEQQRTSDLEKRLGRHL